MNRLFHRLARRARLSEERGAVAVIVALFLLVLLICGALVLDLGALYDHDRELQAAADAGALAGAQELIYTAGSISAATTSGLQYISANSSPNSSVKYGNLTRLDVVPLFTSSEKSCTVDLTESHVMFTLARVMGQYEGTVKAHAKAEIKYLTGVNALAPFAVVIMNPDKFRFVFLRGNTEVGHVDITDGNKDGTFGGSGEVVASFPGAGSLSSGSYSVTMEAISTVSGVDTIALTLPGVGIYWVSDPTSPTPANATDAQMIYRVGMSHAPGGSTVTVQLQLAPDLAAELGSQALSFSLGGNGGTLSKIGASEYRGTVAAPTGTSNEGYAVNGLLVHIPKTTTWKKADITCGRYLNFNPDVPITYVMMENSFYSGYSRKRAEGTSPQPQVMVHLPAFGEQFTLKLGSASGAGLYSGNHHIVDIYKAPVQTRDEIGTMDPSIISTWTPNHPLVIGGILDPQTGNAAGTVNHGLLDRIAAAAAMGDPEAWRDVVVPLVDYKPDLSGSSDHYTIRMFAMFHIMNSPSDFSSGKTDIIGEFIEDVTSGDQWSDTPSGPVYVETAVLTE